MERLTKRNAEGKAMPKTLDFQLLINKLCEYEEDGEWEKFLDSILIELDGFSEEEKTINYYILYKKLSSLRYLRYKYFRPAIFECMSLVGK